MIHRDLKQQFLQEHRFVVRHCTSGTKIVPKRRLFAGSESDLEGFDGNQVLHTWHAECSSNVSGEARKSKSAVCECLRKGV